MNKFKIILIISIISNFGLGFILFATSVRNNDLISQNLHNEYIDPLDKIRFHKIFIEKKVNVYHFVFNSSFENDPLDSYLLACSYYVTTGDTAHIADIKTVSVEINSAFGKAPKIDFHNKKISK